MLTTEVVKGLLEGKTYSRFTVNDNPMAIKIYDKVVMMKLGKFPWREMIFDSHDLQGDWKEVIEWQEIPWQEAVDCEAKGIPLQYSKIGDLSNGRGKLESWHDAPHHLGFVLLGFVCNHKWRKKVEAKDA